MDSDRIDILTKLGMAKVTLHGVPDVPGVAGKVFGSLGEAGHNVELVISSGGEGNTQDISFAIHEDELSGVLESVKSIGRDVGAKDVTHNRDVALVSILGPGLARTPGVAGRMFRALSEVGVNIDLISTSITSVTCLISRGSVEKAEATLEETFGPVGSGS